MTRNELKQRVEILDEDAVSLAHRLQRLLQAIRRAGYSEPLEYLRDAHTCASDVSAALADVVPAWDEEEEGD